MNKKSTEKFDELNTIVVRPTQHGDKRSEFSYLVMIYGEHLGRRYTIKSEPLTIGRSPDCKIQLSDESVSRVHCRLFPKGEGVMLDDLDSTNGTYINGKSVDARLLRDGDQILVGRGIFKYIDGDNIEHAYHEEIFRLMTTDHLTGSFNKKYFENELKREFYRYFRHKRPLTLAMIDIDHFKRVNDEHGHLAGDRVLGQLGKLVSNNVRMEDIFCRYGGEEFALLMPELDQAGAVDFAERLRQVVQGGIFKYEDLVIPVTISIGVAQADSTMKKPEDLVDQADRMLYHAKTNGRNRVEPGL